jgi:hypothetical protein
LPDPKDGSLYALGDGMNGIKKLPFTIPQLVSASPCKSNEGMLYTGIKTNYRVKPVKTRPTFVFVIDSCSAYTANINKKFPTLGHLKFGLYMIWVRQVSLYF